MIPGSPEWELEMCRQDFNAAGARLRILQRQVDEAFSDLIRKAEYFGRAQEAVRKASV